MDKNLFYNLSAHLQHFNLTCRPLPHKPITKTSIVVVAIMERAYALQELNAYDETRKIRKAGANIGNTCS